MRNLNVWQLPGGQGRFFWGFAGRRSLDSILKKPSFPTSAGHIVAIRGKGQTQPVLPQNQGNVFQSARSRGCLADIDSWNIRHESWVEI